MKKQQMLIIAVTIISVGIAMLLINADTTKGEKDKIAPAPATKPTEIKEKRDKAGLHQSVKHTNHRHKIWPCTCQLYADINRKWVGEWSGIVSSNASRWYTEKVEANRVCEEKTARQGRAVDCKDCRCGQHDEHHADQITTLTWSCACSLCSEDDNELIGEWRGGVKRSSKRSLDSVERISSRVACGQNKLPKTSCENCRCQQTTSSTTEESIVIYLHK